MKVLRKTKVWLLIVPLLLTALGIVGYNFVRARSTKATNACINNLRQVDGAKQQWMLEHDRTNGPVSWKDVQPYLGRGPEGEIPKCPDGGTYMLGRVGEKPRCSIGGRGHNLQ
jgi:hypothetical protein